MWETEGIFRLLMYLTSPPLGLSFSDLWVIIVYFYRHVSSEDRVGKRYRNMASVFTIGDEEEPGG